MDYDDAVRRQLADFFGFRPVDPPGPDDGSTRPPEPLTEEDVARAEAIYEDGVAAATKPPTPENPIGLRFINRRILAEKGNWPAGALQACERLSSSEWYVMWQGENTFKGFERPAGFRAVRRGWHEVQINGPTAEGVARAMELAPPEHVFGDCWCKNQDVPKVIVIRLDA